MTTPTLARNSTYQLWPSYVPPSEVAALGGGGRTWWRYVLASGLLVVPFLFEPVSRATHLGPWHALAIIAVFNGWQCMALPLQRHRSRFLSFHLVLIGNLFINTALAMALAVISGDPRTPLWCFACAYACMNAASVDLPPSLGILAVHAILPIVAIPMFLARGADPTWSFAGPLIASTASVLGYHVIGIHTAGAREMRDERDAALEQLRLVEAERARSALARDLHDSIGAALLVASCYGELLERGVPATEIAQLASGLRTSARDGLSDLRAILSGISPASGSLASLAAEFRAAAARLQDAAKVELDVRTPTAEIELPPAVRTALARVFQEATHNAIRHGGARHIEVSLDMDGPMLTLTVADDGRGVRESAPPGRGLAGMRERASELGGEFALESRPGGGTSVRIAFPVGRAARAPIPSSEGLRAATAR